MTRRPRLRGRQLTELVRAADPCADAGLVASAHDREARALFEAIVAGTDRHEVTEVLVPDKRFRFGRLPLSFAAAVVTLVVALVTVLVAVGTSRATAVVALQSRHHVIVEANLPTSAVHDGTIEWSKVPAFVSVESRGVVVGYVRKADLRHPVRLPGPLLPVPPCGTDGVAVFDAHRELVGHIYPDAGFTRRGVAPRCPSPQSPSTVPQIPSTPPSGMSLGGSGGATSSGDPAGVPLPDVRYEALDLATRTLQAAGFQVVVTLVHVSGTPSGTVVTQSPAPGNAPGSAQRLAKGSEVRISVASGPVSRASPP